MYMACMRGSAPAIAPPCTKKTCAMMAVRCSLAAVQARLCFLGRKRRMKPNRKLRV
ncbi:hypothetical protein D3C73_1537520 [compost metagenome]